MSESQIKLLEKALELYSKAIEVTKEYENENEKDNEFYYMVEALSKKIGVNLKYWWFKWGKGWKHKWKRKNTNENIKT